MHHSIQAISSASTISANSSTRATIFQISIYISFYSSISFSISVFCFLFLSYPVPFCTLLNRTVPSCTVPSCILLRVLSIVRSVTSPTLSCSAPCNPLTSFVLTRNRSVYYSSILSTPIPSDPPPTTHPAQPSSTLYTNASPPTTPTTRHVTARRVRPRYLQATPLPKCARPLKPLCPPRASAHARRCRARDLPSSLAVYARRYAPLPRHLFSAHRDVLDITAIALTRRSHHLSRTTRHVIHHTTRIPRPDPPRIAFSCRAIQIAPAVQRPKEKRQSTPRRARAQCSTAALAAPLTAATHVAARTIEPGSARMRFTDTSGVGGNDTGLPLDYNEAAIHAYWNARLGACRTRFFEVTAVLAPLIASVAFDVSRGKLA